VAGHVKVSATTPSYPSPNSAPEWPLNSDDALQIVGIVDGHCCTLQPICRTNAEGVHEQSLKRMVCTVLLGALAGCGGNHAVTPTPITPSVAQVAGVWTGTVTQVRASGVECAALFQVSNGHVDDDTVSIEQHGIGLVANGTSQTTGQNCAYAGGAGSNSIVLQMTSCQPSSYQVTCAGVARDVALVSHSLAGMVVGNTITGTLSTTWNVFPRGATTGIGLVVVTASVSLSR
jgi:hypothetical protein